MSLILTLLAGMLATPIPPTLHIHAPRVYFFPVTFSSTCYAQSVGSAGEGIQRALDITKCPKPLEHTVYLPSGSLYLLDAPLSLPKNRAIIMSNLETSGRAQ